MRICSVCKSEKPLNAFPGKAPRCLECRKEFNRQKQRRYLAKRASLSHRVCPGCEEDLPAASFTKGAYHCRPCHRKYQNAWRASTPQRKLKQLRNAARSNGRSRGFHFDLSIRHLEELWDQQGGRCFYTGIKLTHASDRASTAISIDRMDPSGGYVKGNVVLASWGANQMKAQFTCEQLADYCRLYLRWFDGQAA